MEASVARSAIKDFYKIQADFQAAKSRKKQAIRVLLLEQKTQKRECLMNLRKAKRLGDEILVKECREAINQAAIEMKRAKEELISEAIEI